MHVGCWGFEFTLVVCCRYYAAACLFVSNLNVWLAQRFLALVWLAKVRSDIATHQRLHSDLFQALKKATYKAAAFLKVGMAQRSMLSVVHVVVYAHCLLSKKGSLLTAYCDLGVCVDVNALEHYWRVLLKWKVRSILTMKVHAAILPLSAPALIASLWIWYQGLSCVMVPAPACKVHPHLTALLA